jgi:hypothetical protein
MTRTFLRTTLVAGLASASLAGCISITNTLTPERGAPVAAAPAATTQQVAATAGAPCNGACCRGGCSAIAPAERDPRVVYVPVPVGGDDDSPHRSRRASDPTIDVFCGHAGGGSIGGGSIGGGSIGDGIAIGSKRDGTRAADTPGGVEAGSRRDRTERLGERATVHDGGSARGASVSPDPAPRRDPAGRVDAVTTVATDRASAEKPSGTVAQDPETFTRKGREAKATASGSSPKATERPHSDARTGAPVMTPAPPPVRIRPVDMTTAPGDVADSATSGAVARAAGDKAQDGVASDGTVSDGTVNDGDVSDAVERAETAHARSDE